MVDSGIRHNWRCRPEIRIAGNGDAADVIVHRRFWAVPARGSSFPR